MEWSVRLATNNNCDPSGLHSSELTDPRVVKIFLAALDPSMDAVQTCPDFMNATVLLSGDTAGPSPSDKNLVSPPAKGTVPTCTLNGLVSLAALIGRPPS